MKIVFPKLDLLVSKDAKLNEDNIKKYIHVIDNHAIVVNGSITVVNIREHVKIECEITDDFESLDKILSFFNGKSFTPDVWKEFTNPADVHLNGDDITLEGLNYSKTISYEEPPVVINHVLDILISNLNSEPVNVAVSALNFNELNKIVSCFKKELKGLHFVLKNCGQDTYVMFQAETKDYIFGMIPTSFNAATDVFNFVKVQEFHKLICDTQLG